MTLILSKWKPLLAYLPVETAIRDRQDDYYGVLRKCDQSADSTLFVEFMLNAILEALRENISTDQVGDQVTDQVVKLLNVFKVQPLSASELMKNLGLAHRPTFRNNYLHPALNKGLIEMTVPEKPNSRLQKYRITEKGTALKKNDTVLYKYQEKDVKTAMKEATK